MTRYSRAVIPGRPNEASSLNSEIENLVSGRAEPANDAQDEDEVSEDEKIAFVERAASDRRAKSNDRRKGSRRRVSDFAPLPGEAAHRATDGGSMRGPLLLAGALVVVAVFGVVVWNAYRDGVRPEDSAAAPVIAEEGAFKSKPAPEARTAAAPAEATVFEQVEARPNPAPEVREEIPAAEPPKAVEPVKQAAKPVESKPAPAPAKPATATTAAQTGAKTPAGTVGTTKPTVLPVVGGPAKPTATPQATAQVATPAKPAAAPAPAPARPAAAPPAVAEAPTLAGAAAAPAFSPSGKFAVQIAAPSTQAGAEAEWAKAAKKAPELFGSAERIIVQADVNGKTVYRLRAGAFATSADADSFCNAFKAKGGACYRVAK